MFFSLPAKTPEGIDNSRQYRGRKLQRNCPGDFLKNTYLGTHFVFSMLGFFRFCSFLLSNEEFSHIQFFSSSRRFLLYRPPARLTLFIHPCLQLGRSRILSPWLALRLISLTSYRTCSTAHHQQPLFIALCSIDENLSPRLFTLTWFSYLRCFYYLTSVEASLTFLYISRYLMAG